MIKPERLKPGDTVATFSPSLGCAGDPAVRWKYDLGVKRLEGLGLNVVPAPNSMRDEAYLRDNPAARAEDLMWAFENRDIKAIICNIGGNDSERLIPYLSENSIISNPKIFCGYSDAMSLHLYLNRLGLMSYYGDNLLTTVAEVKQWHPYSLKWFKKCFFESEAMGEIKPSGTWSPDANNHTDPEYVKSYVKGRGYERVQGEGIARGKLFGGHGGLMEYPDNSPIKPTLRDFEGKILFYEDIPEFFSLEYIEKFFDWLGTNGFLQVLKGIIVGKMCSHEASDTYLETMIRIVSEKYGLADMPIIYGVNFGHSSPICILPYGAEAELDMRKLKFSILESGVA